MWLKRNDRLTRIKKKVLAVAVKGRRTKESEKDRERLEIVSTST